MKPHFCFLMFLLSLFIITASGCPQKNDTTAKVKNNSNERKQDARKKSALKQPDPLDALTRDLCDNNKARLTILSDALVEFNQRVKYNRTIAKYTGISNEDEFVKTYKAQHDFSKGAKWPLFIECRTTVVKMDCDAAYAEISADEDGPRSLLGGQAFKRLGEIGHKMGIRDCARINSTISRKDGILNRNYYAGMYHGTMQIFALINKYD